MESMLFMFILGHLVIRSEGFATLTVPTAGNCGDDTVLTCSVTGSISGNTGWFGLGRDLVINDSPAKPEYNNKYTPNKGTTSFTLTIHNTETSDAGEYKCGNGFDESLLVRLNIECKASAVVSSVTNRKKITVTVDKLYPASPTLSASFWKENTAVSIPGARTCSSSTQFQGYYICVWSSSNSLADGSYTYSIVVTTITQADPLTGSFKIVSPQTPVISNSAHLDDNRVAVYGNEGQSVTIKCTSTGGYPTQTVVWYKDSVSSSNQLASNSTGTLQNDGTYIVKLQHTFTPTVYDDRKSFICRSYYPQADSAYLGSEATSVILYLSLRPSQPTIAQVGSVPAGSTVEVRCTTTGSRPAANITWSYQGSTSTGVVTSTLDTSTETYRVESVFRRTVTSADNGRSLQCVVTHTALISPSERTASINLIVQYGPENIEFNPNSTHYTRLVNTTLHSINCTAKCNPSCNFKWDKVGEDAVLYNSAVLSLGVLQVSKAGTYQCTASRSGGASSTKNLEVKVFHPLTVQSFYIEGHTGQNYVTVDEHHAEIQLKCNVVGYPLPTVKLIFVGDTLTEQKGTTTVSLVQNDVSCLDAGVYICEASNEYGRTSSNVTLFVNCSPRPLRQIHHNITSDLHVPITLVFSAIAYPEPGPKGFAWHKEVSVGWLPLLSNTDLRISTSGLQSNLTLMNVLREDLGHYRITVTNNIGTYEQHLFLSKKGQEGEQTRESENCETGNSAVIVGVTLGLVCGILASYAAYRTILIKRKAIRKDNRSMAKASKQTTYANDAFTTSANEQQGELENVTTGGEESSAQQYTELSRYANTDKDTYDVIQKT